MAKLGDFVVNVGADTSEFDSAMADIPSKLVSVSNGVEKASKAMAGAALQPPYESCAKPLRSACLLEPRNRLIRTA